MIQFTITMDKSVAPDLPMACGPEKGEGCDEGKIAADGLDRDLHLTERGRVEMDVNEADSGVADLLTALNRRKSTFETKPDATHKREPDTPFPMKMNLVIHVVGSRGDVQPFIVLGKALMRHGHRVRLATHLVFRNFVRENGLEFFNIGGDPAELMSFMVKNPKLIPKMNSLLQGAIGRRRKEIRTIIGGCWRSCMEAGEGLDSDSDAPLKERPFVADAIIANPPSFAHIHCAEKLGIPLHMMFTMPWSPTQAFPHPLANVRTTDIKPSVAKFASYAITEILIWQGVGDLQNDFRRYELGLEQLDALRAPSILHRLRIPFTYFWSPSLLPKPGDWESHIDISGFNFLQGNNTFEPPQDLAHFLETGPPPIYVGFGSIVVDDPDALTRTVLDAVRITGQRALISQGWGGLGGSHMVDGLDQDVMFIGSCPHDWLFPRVSCVVHHGGAGTTAIGLALGRPTTIVPFFGDQPFWGSLVALNNAGAHPITFTKLTADKLAEAINFCLEPQMIARVQQLSDKIQTEQGAEDGVASFHRQLDLPKLQCNLCHDRPAVWRVRKTKILLSAFAAAVLVQENKLDPCDVRLYHSTHYEVNHDPRGPICQAIEGLAGSMTSFLSGLAEFPMDVIYSFSQDVSARFAESYGLSAWDARASVASTATTGVESTSTTVAPSTGDQTVLSERAGSISDQSSSRNGSQLMPAMAEKQRSKGRTLIANTSYTGRRVLNWIVELPMGLTLGLSQGFHEVPRWYHDRTVRETPQVRGFRSGIDAAKQEFSYSWYDGISGVVTQPRHGWKEGGFIGMVKGAGKGLGGLLLKPPAGLWGLFGYPLYGIHRRIERSYGVDRQCYIVASRIRQGLDEWEAASPNEREEVLSQWPAYEKIMRSKHGQTAS
ncbi:UDP-Glycosyltransferase/glycogen phosphorylase [Aspergillus taichungensis]|uniref:UDP-Glycosyltransferase/glycogen phosphorylase n=1 Tax=Aspergillus taichungensis TaxID=482145 RepID=A0A2J5HES1_9EURO|nr:UDP-Glycosyltransferase/glycogen phosphorylase [Aspergillus taichungensis]